MHPNKSQGANELFPPRNPFVSFAAVDGKSVWSASLKYGVPWTSQAIRQLSIPSSLRPLATATIDGAVTTSDRVSEPCLDISAISTGDSSTITAEWSQLSNTTSKNARRLDSKDGGFVCASARSSVVRDADLSRFLTLYNQPDEVPPDMYVFTFVALYVDYLDT